jgi:hypothetical protein
VKEKQFTAENAENAAKREKRIVKMRKEHGVKDNRLSDLCELCGAIF